MEPQTTQVSAPLPLRQIGQGTKLPEQDTKTLQVRPLSAPPGKRKSRLKPRDVKFINYYMQGMSGYKAAEAAGCPEGTCRLACYMFLENPAVVSEINRRIKLKFRQLEIDTDRVLDETIRTAFANILDYIKVTEDGKFEVDLKNIDRYAASAITEISYDVEGRVKIKLADKNPALERLARYFKIGLDKGKEADDTEKPITVNYLDAIIHNHVHIHKPERPLLQGKEIEGELQAVT